MIKHLTKNYRFLTVFFLIFLSAHALHTEMKDVRVIISGVKNKTVILYNISPFNYFHVKDIATFYDVAIEWYPISGRIDLLKNSRRLEMYLNTTRMRLDGKKHRLTIPCRLEDNKVLVPAELLTSEVFSDFAATNTLFNPSTLTLTLQDRTNIIISDALSLKNKTRVVLTLLDDLSYKWKQRKSYIMIDFPRALVKEEILEINNGIITNIDAKNKNNHAIIKISLAPEAVAPDVTVREDAQRVTIEIYGEVLENKSIQTTASVPSSIQLVSIPKTGTSSKTKHSKKKPSGNKKLIILDAGHGGVDPGAIGPGGTKEKDITLSIVKKLKKILEKDGLYEVILTRSDDTFIPLIDRTSLANAKNAYLFISVHCNASLNKKSTGFEVYFLSENASDSEAAATAVLENSVIHFEDDKSAEKEELQELFWSMAKNEFINESSELSSLIVDDVIEQNNVHSRGVKQAGFFVLRGAAMPALLIEAAFLSNAKEEKELRKSRFQNAIAESIHNGIREYEARKINE